jgi:hypothetical protein
METNRKQTVIHSYARFSVIPANAGIHPRLRYTGKLRRSQCPTPPTNLDSGFRRNDGRYSSHAINQVCISRTNLYA